MREGIRSLFRFRGFAPLWSGHLVSRFGDAITSIALIWLALELSGSALIMSTVMIFSMLPSLLFTIPAGVFVDRHSRKMVLMLSSAGRVFINITLFLLTFSGSVELWHLYLLAFTDSTVECFFGPALGATIPNIVDEEHLLSANSAMSITTSVSQMVGMGAGGTIIGFIGVPLAFLICSLAYAVAVVSIAAIRLKEKTERAKSEGRLKDIREGLGFVAKNRTLMIIIVVAVVLNFGAGALNVIIPVLSENMGMGAEGFGYMIASFSAGSLLGAVVLSEIGGSKKIRTETIVITMPLIWAIGFLCAPIFRTLPPYIAIFCAIGVSNAFGGAAVSTILQRSTPDEMRGRVISIEHLIILVLMPLSAAAAGPLIELYGIGFTFYCIATVSFLAFLVALMGLGRRNKNES